ncbi:hypothetical protein E2562_009707 [Oryza meyeriana var. granulata]|uniref:Uncharacterized protein n=1 Tax=Oryza meyeriana var. granulata TaxID=110450 RepID=A0A6G1D1P9_9ORYZ|nr:hypothetical protein E2562_009707 [Oryza meyeriana var. granulata]
MDVAPWTPPSHEQTTQLGDPLPHRHLCSSWCLVEFVRGVRATTTQLFGTWLPVLYVSVMYGAVFELLTTGAKLVFAGS